MEIPFRYPLDEVLQLKQDVDPGYRQSYLQRDLIVTRTILVFVSLVIGLFAISDYLINGFSSVFFGLVTLRIGLIAFCLTVVWKLKRANDYRYFDRGVVACMMIVIIGVLIVNLTRPLNFLPQVIIVDIGILIIYLLLPTRFIYQIFAALTFSIGESAILLAIVQPQVMGGVFTAGFSMFFVNVIAAFASWHIHTYRSSMYKDNLKYQESKRLAAIGETAGMVGHDIRNPLQSIVGEVYLLKDEVATIQDEDKKRTMQESVASIENNIQYINKIVADLQDYARPLSPHFEEVTIEHILKQVLTRRAIPERIEVAYDIEPGARKIVTDGDMLKRILANLVNNAIQAMPETGKLTIRVLRVQENVVLVVEDTGPGIPEEIQVRMFTPLFTTKSKGQGFGLAAVKRLTEAIGGTVTFQTQVAKGTKFFITLPVNGKHGSSITRRRSQPST